jgi:hypothetical protein
MTLIHRWPANRNCFSRMSPCVSGGTCVALLTSAKFWQMRHFGCDVGASEVKFGSSRGGISWAGGRPFAMHSSFNLWSMSFIDIPPPVCAFWARVVGEHALTSSGAMRRIIPASSSSSIVL